MYVVDKCYDMAGAWGVRTRAITAGPDGTLEWTERLIIELQGPIGTLHVLQCSTKLQWLFNAKLRWVVIQVTVLLGVCWLALWVRMPMWNAACKCNILGHDIAQPAGNYRSMVHFVLAGKAVVITYQSHLL